VAAPSAVVGNTDGTAVQMLALLNREGKELAKRVGQNEGWPILRKEYTFSLVVGTASYDLPADFGYFINATGWDRSRKWQLVGPVSPSEWQFLKSGYPATGFLYRFRIMQGQIYFDPTPNDVSSIAIEYYSKYWATVTGGTTPTKETFTVDTDIPLLDDFLLELGLKWRYLRAKGLDYEQEYRTYEDAVERALGRSTTGRDLSLNSQPGIHRLIDQRNVPDTGYGS